MNAIWSAFALVMFVLAEDGGLMVGRSVVTKGDMLRQVVHNAEFKIERAEKIKIELEESNHKLSSKTNNNSIQS